MIPGCDALAELLEFRTRKQLLELRLPDQDYLNQLFFLGLNVREHSDLLEHGGVEILGLIDDEHHILAPEAFFEKEPVEFVDKFFLGLARGVDAEIGIDRLEEFDFREVGVEDDRAFGAVVHLVQQVPAKRRLAGANFACDHHEAAALLDAIAKMRNCFLMLIAQV